MNIKNINKTIITLSAFLLTNTVLAAPTATETALADLGVGRVVFGLLAVLAVIYALAWMVKKQQGIKGYFTPHMSVVGVLPMGKNEKIVLINVGNEQLLLGVSSQQITTLHKIETPLTNEPVTSDFSKKLKEIIGKGISQ
jgi:flagellar protein FliO/FliZ